MRLIDADVLINTLNEGKIKFNADINYIILNAPTVEAEPIVRCKDCRWFNDRLKRDGAEDNRYAPSICTLHGRPHSNTYFCADGEVKDETNRCRCIERNDM